MPKKTFVRRAEAVEAVQWDGTNGEDVIGSLPSSVPAALSPDGTSIVIWQIDRWMAPPINSWFVTTGDVVVAMSDEDFQAAFDEVTQ